MIFVYRVILVCELSKEKPSVKWEIEADDGDGDFLCHTLFLKQVNYILQSLIVTVIEAILQRWCSVYCGVTVLTFIESLAQALYACLKFPGMCRD